METRIFIMDILAFLCIPIYAKDSETDDIADEYLENLTVNSGTIATSLFNFQDNFGNYSNITKLLYCYSENKGFSASYQFHDCVSADAMIVPLEGDDKINYRFGVTFCPIEGMQLRLYGGVNDSQGYSDVSTYNMAAFLGYKCDKFALGAELNHTMNSSYTIGRDYYGYSIFASVKMAEFADFYLRFDDIYSKNNWNILRDEQSTVLGVQFRLNDKVKIAPNFKMIVPKAQGLGRSYLGYVNCSIEL